MMDVELNLAPEWSAVKDCWDDCVRHFTEAGLDEDTAYGLSMSAQELLENAVKYSAPLPGERIQLTLERNRSEVTIQVRSRAHPDPRFLRRLDETIQWIRGFQNPFEAYVERLKAVSATPYQTGQSGLGLSRVAYEGRCILDFYVDAEGMLALSAVYPLDNAVDTSSDAGASRA